MRLFAVKKKKNRKRKRLLLKSRKRSRKLKSGSLAVRFFFSLFFLFPFVFVFAPPKDLRPCVDVEMKLAKGTSKADAAAAKAAEAGKFLDPFCYLYTHSN